MIRVHIVASSIQLLFPPVNSLGLQDVRFGSAAGPEGFFPSLSR